MNKSIMKATIDPVIEDLKANLKPLEDKVEELKKLIERQTKDIITNSKELAQNLYPTLTDMLDVWGNLNSSI